VGLIALASFFGGLVACIPLIIAGVVLHRRRTTAEGKNGMWFRFFFLSVALTIATLFISFQVLFPDSHGAPIWDDYESIIALAAIVPSSPGIGTIFAAFFLTILSRETQ